MAGINIHGERTHPDLHPLLDMIYTAVRIRSSGVC